MTKQPVSLGYMNGWQTDPPQFVECRKARHPVKTAKGGREIYEYTCETCGITWLVDSSD